MAVLLVDNFVENLDISTEIEVLNFTYVGSDPAVIICRMMVDGGSAGIAGGYYYPLMYVNDIVFSPVFPVNINAGADFMVSTKTDLIIQNDVVSLRLIGQPSDTNVSVRSHIVDTLHLSNEQIASLTSVINNSLSAIHVSNERVILGPTKPCTKRFSIPTTQNVKKFLLPKR